MVSSMMSSRFGEGFRQPSDREDIVYRDRGQLGLFTAVIELQPYFVFAIELERGGVGLACLALETFHLCGAPSCEELFRLALGDAFAGDFFPDREVASGLLPRRATVGFLRLDDRSPTLGASADRLAAARGSCQPFSFHPADLFDELGGEAVYVGHKVRAALGAFLHLREPLLPAGRELRGREWALPEESDQGPPFLRGDEGFLLALDVTHLY